MDYESILDARGDNKFNVFLFKPEMRADGYYGGVIERFRFSKVGYFYNGVSISIIPQKADIHKHKFWVTKNYYMHGYFIHTTYAHPQEGGGTKDVPIFKIKLYISLKTLPQNVKHLVTLENVATIKMTKKHDIAYVRYMYKQEIIILNELVLEVPTWAFKTKEEEDEPGDGDIDIFDDSKDNGEGGEKEDGTDDFFDIKPFEDNQKTKNVRLLENKNSPNFEI